MKSFQFKLETVLHIRKNKVEVELASLSKVVGEINYLQNEISQNNQNIQKEYDNYNKQIIEGNSLYYIRIFDNYLKGLNQKNDSLQQEIESYNDELNESRQKVIEARKNAEVLEIIKKKQKEEYEDRLRRSERYELEEINQSVYEKNKKEGKHEHERIHPKDVSKEKQKTKPPVEKPKSQYEQLLEFIRPKK